jgi:hypothetical protein
MLMFRDSYQPERTESRLLDYWEAGMQRGKRDAHRWCLPRFSALPLLAGLLEDRLNRRSALCENFVGSFP